ncbi:MAG TPA: hypothetical protein EYP68_02630 [Candidatus Korarchaeota archaeon]|nr:hypothetical protein [Candidatus Korarchaeota archaeon]
MSTRLEKIEEKLRELETAVPNIEGSAVISLDGLVMASRFRSDVSEERVAAMSSALLSIAERINEELGRGDFQRALVTGRNGFIVLTPAGPDALIACICSKEAKLGMIFYELDKLSREITQIISGP